MEVVALKKFFLILTQGHFSWLLERKGERKGERNVHAREEHPLPASCTCRDLGLNRSLGMYPDQELNLQPFRYRVMLQPAEPHQPGITIFF